MSVLNNRGVEVVKNKQKYKSRKDDKKDYGEIVVNINYSKNSKVINTHNINSYPIFSCPDTKAALPADSSLHHKHIPHMYNNFSVCNRSLILEILDSASMLTILLVNR